MCNSWRSVCDIQCCNKLAQGPLNSRLRHFSEPDTAQHALSALILEAELAEGHVVQLF